MQLIDAFTRSLSSWGGMGAKMADDQEYLLRPVSPVDAVSPDYPPPNYQAQPEQWRAIAPVMGTFINAYVTQELDRLLDGPGDLRWAVDTLESPAPILFLLALVLVARENGVGVECEWQHPRTSMALFARLASSYRSTLLISLRRSVADHGADFLLRLSGSETRRDQNDPSRFYDHHVERSAVVQCDREIAQPRPNKALESDIFLQDRGFPLFHFSTADIMDDCFGCASKVFRALNNSEVVTDEV